MVIAKQTATQSVNQTYIMVVSQYVSYTFHRSAWAWFCKIAAGLITISFFPHSATQNYRRAFPFFSCVKSKLRVFSHVKQQVTFYLTTLGRKMARFQLVMASS